MSTGFEPTPVEDPLAVIADFLSEFQRVIPEALDSQSSWFQEALRQPLQDAWDELDPSFAMADRYTREPPDARLFEAQLAHVGLTGAQLRLKVGAFRGALGTWRQDLSKKGLQSLLGWANIILGSLAGIVPGAEAIKEYKEAFEQTVEDGDTDDEGRRPNERGREFKL